MNRYVLPMLWFSIACSVITAKSMAADGQLQQPIKWIPVHGEPDQFWMSQITRDDTLILTPNNAFFPQRGLIAAGKGTVADIDNLNGGKSFDRITGWSAGLKAEWGVWFAKAGEVRIAANITKAGRFSVSLGDRTKPLKSGIPVTFSISAPGKQSVILACESTNQPVEFRKLVVTGNAVSGSAVIRKRWRPAAAHTRFYSSSAPDQIRMWIMEMDAVPGSPGFYSPITTPFGYYGPTWKADGTVNSGFNFSLWSYGRNEKEPPVERLSHLVAIGNPTASFGRFGHEGTGVKIRDWEPLAGQQGQRQAFALRVEPGKIYDTYISYFYSDKDHQWKLFGAGKKYNKGKPIRSLWAGSFVEVPGPPHVQRTGAYPRRMKYRGWVVDDKNRLHALDRMKNGNIDRETGYTHTNRGVNRDGWFFLETGGWTFQRPPNGGEDIVRQQSDSQQPLPPFLKREKLQFLNSIPGEISVTGVQRNDHKTEVTFRVRGLGNQPAVTAYWGSCEGLTFVERWEHHHTTKTPTEGINRITLPGTRQGSPLYVRLLLRNSAGQFWSRDTFVDAK